MTVAENEKTGSEPLPEMKEEPTSRDIVQVLEGAGHRTAEYPNGLVLGMKVTGVPGTRGVRVDVVYILDLRRAKFGRSNLAIQAALLESVSRPLENVLRDVEMEELLTNKSLRSLLGRIEFRVLKSLTSDYVSLIHETRTIYAVYREGDSHRNLSWLTDPSRVIPDSELGLLLGSDARSQLQEVQRSVDPDKWDDLERGFERSWLGVLPIIMGAIASLGVAGAVLTGGSLFFPVIASVVCVPVTLWLLREASVAMNDFRDALEKEVQALSKIGDAARVQTAIGENETRLGIVGTLNFIVTPLMDSAAVAIEGSDVNASVNSLSSVLDECVRLAPLSIEGEPRLSGDPGMEKFISLFRHLGLEFQDGEEEALGLGYVALTGHNIAPLKEHEVIHHIATLNNSLFDVGALSPAVKNRIDDLLIIKVRDTLKREYDEELAKPDELSTDIEESSEIAVEGNEEELDEVLHEMVEGATVEDPTQEEPPATEGPLVLVAKTVMEPQEEELQAVLEPEPKLETGDAVVEQAKRKRRHRSVTDSLAHIRKKESEAAEF